ncbi:hypothetical protein [Streptomyces sp. 130]|uniref:hypothetical protein n=1 Tax=Streptomyces sp. 130 TaxID=2591006 RepID=UPI00163D5CF0|nr:hypothetical protein [Streptomyces sp. 130]
MGTGPQRYPGAQLSHWYQGRYGGDAMESNVVVWHTTEGTSLPDYGGGASAPNFTAVPDFANKRLNWYQHFDFDISSRALVNKAGGVETNTLNAVQVELVGTCDPTTHKRWDTKPHLYTPELPAWVIRDLGAFARWARDHHDVPLTSGQTFVAYPASFGATKTRMTNAEWNNFRGHCGHQHVPENDHGDPGRFPIAAILKAATTTTQETPVADLTAFDVWNYKNTEQGETSDTYAYLRNTKAKVDDIKTDVIRVGGQVAEQRTTLVAIFTLLKSVSDRLDQLEAKA